MIFGKAPTTGVNSKLSLGNILSEVCFFAKHGLIFAAVFEKRPFLGTLIS
jgi:hypothetical protein